MGYVDLLVQRAKLEKATVTRSATGEETDTWTTQFTDVPVLVRPLKSDADVPHGLSEAVTHMVHMEVLTDVLSGRWRAIVDGREYRFVDVRDPGQRGHHYEVLSRREG